MHAHLVEVGAQLEQADRAARLGDRVEQHVAQHAQHRGPLDLQLGVHVKVRARERVRVRARERVRVRARVRARVRVRVRVRVS